MPKAYEAIITVTYDEGFRESSSPETFRYSASSDESAIEQALNLVRECRLRKWCQLTGRVIIGTKLSRLYEITMRDIELKGIV